MPKARRVRLMDLPPPVTAGGSGAPENTGAVDDVAPPVTVTVGPPQNLALSTGTAYSSAAPSAYVNATWDAPESTFGGEPEYYVIQVSTSNTFTASGTITKKAIEGSARIEPLLPGTLYYVRVRAYSKGLSSDWTATSSITTATDTTAASVPTSQAATWVGTGDLLITWVNPSEANFKDVKIVVRASSGGTILRTFYSSAQHWLYTFSMNLADTSGVPDSSLYVELQSRTFSNVLSSTVNTGLVTKAAPAAPTGVAQSWSGDTGTALDDWMISWTPASSAAQYRVTIDGVNHFVAGTASHYTLTLAANASEHSGTPDPSFTYSLVALDAFSQASTAVSGTATNAAPATPTATLTQGAVSGLHATVTSTPPADFLTYEYVFKRESTTVATVLSRAQSVSYPMQGAGDDGYHSWTVVIRQEDAFGQFSSTVTPSAVAFEALTLTGLRAQAAYTDSDGNNATTLAALKDGITTSGGVSYAA